MNDQDIITVTGDDTITIHSDNLMMTRPLTEEELAMLAENSLIRGWLAGPGVTIEPAAGRPGMITITAEFPDVDPPTIVRH